MKTEQELLEAFNLSMSNRVTYDHCSRPARSWINRTIAENTQAIHELVSLSALPSKPQAGLIAADSEQSNGGSQSGSGRSGNDGSTSASGDFHSNRYDIKGQSVIGRRYIKAT